MAVLFTRISEAIEAFRLACVPWACVMDADLEYPPNSLLQILSHAHENGKTILSTLSERKFNDKSWR